MVFFSIQTILPNGRDEVNYIFIYRGTSSVFTLIYFSMKMNLFKNLSYTSTKNDVFIYLDSKTRSALTR